MSFDHRLTVGKLDVHEPVQRARIEPAFVLTHRPEISRERFAETRPQPAQRHLEPLGSEAGLADEEIPGVVAVKTQYLGRCGADIVARVIPAFLYRRTQIEATLELTHRRNHLVQLPPPRAMGKHPGPRVGRVTAGVCFPDLESLVDVQCSRVQIAVEGCDLADGQIIPVAKMRLAGQLPLSACRVVRYADHHEACDIGFPDELTDCRRGEHSGLVSDGRPHASRPVRIWKAHSRL